MVNSKSCLTYISGHLLCFDFVLVYALWQLLPSEHINNLVRQDIPCFARPDQPNGTAARWTYLALNELFIWEGLETMNWTFAIRIATWVICTSNINI